ncbi:MAG TPA: polymer-forming cytoskeletal protein, partial [Longimicrobiales bacterium]|nr:polymer-forming cytoskeletal protein [Longimicrobiales bacterium]
DLEEHTVTVGSDGRVTASIVARVVTVEGRVDGDIEARERIVLRASSQVEGDITAPRVVLEDGARFRGGVDMGEAGARTSSSGSSSSTGKAGEASSGSKGSGSNGSRDTSPGSSSRREATASASSSVKGSSS